MSSPAGGEAEEVKNNSSAQVDTNKGEKDDKGEKGEKEKGEKGEKEEPNNAKRELIRRQTVLAVPKLTVYVTKFFSDYFLHKCFLSSL